MSDVMMSLPFPLDDDGFFRRECPLCHKEFKVLLEEEELADLAQNGLNSFMLDTENEKLDLIEDELSEVEITCPYCGQRAPRESWWTQEQLAYVSVVANNIMAKIVNETFIRPMKRSLGSGTTPIRFEGKEMEQQEPWISPEVNDMVIFELPCCQRKIKIEENWTDMIFCIFCGFPYANKDVGAENV